MERYIVEIELLSEAIFGNGESSTSFVDVEVQRDENGIPFFKGKTFKGKLREEAEEIASVFFGEKKDEIISSLFGSEEKRDGSVLRFSDCTISDKVKNNLIYGIENKIITPYDILESLTDIRSFTRIDSEGIAQKGSLRQARVIKKGLKFYCMVDAERPLNCHEEGLLACAVRSLRNLGTMESRGKGQVFCRLMKENEDITSKCINALEKEVM